MGAERTALFNTFRSMCHRNIVAKYFAQNSQIAEDTSKMNAVRVKSFPTSVTDSSPNFSVQTQWNTWQNIRSSLLNYFAQCKVLKKLTSKVGLSALIQNTTLTHKKQEDYRARWGVFIRRNRSFVVLLLNFQQNCRYNPKKSIPFYEHFRISFFEKDLFLHQLVS